ncbi:uncharacterized protein LAESUDRAFT_741045 [Laetiporus sulphureus 93-53]|uniref:DUF1766-domain-containing protein n=1 Tax=Laetiporus sulphureus 93-53 TaxID=1314785 RepID=A0A165HE11_9APHY|nr:uncharacterized protein LAESUDRAFT_741045 [Laetiporus sulphureus 93-53]KZT11610.1 hypothetical protein LAESUDRAFT_741045 [Laetiporus sulphureus 93-53]
MPCMPSFFHKRRKPETSPPQVTALDVDEITRKLASLTTRDEHEAHIGRQSAFVGGFHPELNGALRPPARHGMPGPRPAPPTLVSMPTPRPAKHPMSRTMQHAVSDSPARDHAQTNHKTSPPPPLFKPVPPAPSRTKPPPANAAQHPTTPKRPHQIQTPGSAHPKEKASRPPPVQAQPTGRPRSQSSPPSPTASLPVTSVTREILQCRGTTKAGARCKRMLHVPAAHQDDPEFEVYCPAHVSDRLKPSSFPTKDNRWVKFEEWIPTYLNTLTQANLRDVMQQPISDADRPGYIYMFEIRDPDQPGLVLFKVGRAVVLNRRIDQWSKQCPSKEQYLRYYYPWPSQEDQQMLARGRVQPGPPGAWCHRLERLVHLELTDLSLNALYNDAIFPDVEPKAEPPKMPERKPCVDCGTLHQEIFRFPLAQHGMYKGREWETLVKPVIDRWARFVEKYYPMEKVE